MRIPTSQYLEKQVVTIAVRNVNSGNVAILDGTPVFFVSWDMAGAAQADFVGGVQGSSPATEMMGADVVSNPSNLAASVTSPLAFLAGLFKGTALQQVTPFSAGITSEQYQQVGEAVVYGFTQAIVTLRTRAASNSSWTSLASRGAGDQLIPESVAGYLSWSASNSGYTQAIVQFALAQSIPSIAAFASNSNTGTGVVPGTITGTGSTLNAVNGTVETARLQVFVNIL